VNRLCQSYYRLGKWVGVRDGADGYDAAWKARCYKGRAKVYYGVNACGIDFGDKPKNQSR
jgi:hypothetical protein